MFTEAEVDEEINATERRVRDCVNYSRHRISSFDSADPDRLNQNFLTVEMTIEQLKGIINSVNNTCLGQSRINKTILKQLPIELITYLKSILHATLSVAYFLDSFKEATLKLIPKQNKNPHLVTDYLHISLLEIPGKFFEEN